MAELPWQYIDVHVHLTHEKFAGDLSEVLGRCRQNRIAAVVNGLEPVSNRHILDLAKSDPDIVIPALGIYPLDAVNDLLPADFPHRVGRFDVATEIAFIRAQAATGSIRAVGECGLDGYWLKEDSFAAQEKVFLSLAAIAVEFDLPLIIHTRKLERRAIELMEGHGVKRLNFHCFGGKVKLAQAAAEKHGWYFSIPANARRSESFRKMLTSLPAEQILTETDAPYLAPNVGERSEPMHVMGTIELLAELRGWSLEDAGQRVWRNFNTLFSKSSK